MAHMQLASTYPTKFSTKSAANPKYWIKITFIKVVTADMVIQKPEKDNPAEGEWARNLRSANPPIKQPRIPATQDIAP